MAKNKAEKAKPAAPTPKPVQLPSREPGSVPEDGVSRREKITSLAYSYWVQRGRQWGSPEEDWFRAEREIDLQHSSSTQVQ